MSVARPGRYGNPFVIERLGELWTVRCTAWIGRAEFRTKADAAGFAVARHRAHLLSPYSLVVPITVQEVRNELAGHDVACYCGLEDVCHGDTLLEVARGEL